MRRFFSLFVGKRLVTTMLFVASLALTLASAVTTFLGMTDYSGFLLVSAGVTFGVQCLLFAISWWLGQNWRRGWGHIIGGGAIFLTCAFVSVFFSFASLYVTIDGGRSDNAAQTRMEDRVSELETQLSRKLSQQIKERSEALLASPASMDWQANVNLVLDRARNAPGELRARATAERDAAQVQLIEEQRQLRAIKDQLEFNERMSSEIDERVFDAESRLDAAQSRLTEARQRLRDIENEIVTQTTRREVEASQGGCGPQCRAIEAVIGDLNVDLAGAQQAVSQAEAFEREAQTNLDVVSQPSSVTVDRDALKEQQALIETRISDITTNINEIEAQLQESAGDSVALVRAHLTDFNRLDFSKFTDAVASCTWLKEQLISAEVMQAATAPDCSGSAIAPELDELEMLVARSDQFAQQCDTSTLFADQLSFAELRTFGDVCIAAAGFIDAETRDIKNELFAMEQSRGEGAHSFAKVQASLFQDNDPLAKFALALAIAIDVLVLLCALIGTNVGSSENARALQYVLLHKKPDPSNEPDEILTEPTTRQEQLLFRNASEWISSRGLGSLVYNENGEMVGLRITTQAASAIQQELFAETGNDDQTSRSRVDAVPSHPRPSAEKQGSRKIRQFGRKTSG